MYSLAALTRPWTPHSSTPGSTTRPSQVYDQAMSLALSYQQQPATARRTRASAACHYRIYAIRYASLHWRNCRGVDTGATGDEVQNNPTKIFVTNEHRSEYNKVCRMSQKKPVLFCSLAVLDPRVGHTMDVLSPFIPVLCHSRPIATKFCYFGCQTV